MMKIKPNKMLNGKQYRYGDLYDSYNCFQQAHFDGTFDVYAPIIQGDSSLPSLAQQWREDYKRRFCK